MRWSLAWWPLRGIVLGLLAFAVFGPIVNLALWAVAERWFNVDTHGNRSGPASSSRF
jgi:hypothetical protein